ncbi:MAG TPA: transglycosylase domain-containing protein [Candidatus Yaniella excrementigallinarum]|nr:transglycosylase domain-containing protein [Candidatus Yaniella excrementigallinarum]
MAKMTSSGSGVLKSNSVLSKLLAFFGISALLGAIGAGIMLPAGMLTGAASQVGTEMLDQLPAELNEEPMSTPSVIKDQDGEEIATFYAEDRTPVELDEISDHMVDAIIAIEDERFYEHGGVDGQGVARAAVHNIVSDTQQGASTLTQQYVNNVLVNYQNLNGLRTTVSGSKEIPDKVREMKLAVAVEKDMSKEEILEGYLNIVLFSGRTYGVEAAARLFFDKSAADLDIPESALLAGLVQSPNALNPETNPEAAKKRRDLVLGNMRNEGFITEDEYEEAVATDINLDMNPLPSGCLYAEEGFGYFCDYVQRLVLADPAFGPDKESRQRMLDRGGLEITTTLDSELQRTAVETAKTNVPADENEGIGAALVTVQQDTGNIKAMAQNTEYSVEEERGSSTLNFSVDHEWGNSGGFQAGSTLKPFVAMAWMGEGNSMRDKVDASRNNYTGAKFPAYCLDGGQAKIGSDGWRPKNAIKDMYKPMRMDYGLYWSINTATIAAAYETDLCSITDITTAAGITGAETGEPLDPSNPSFVLGAQEVSPLTMASAYSTLGSGGTYCEPRAIESIVDAEGEEYTVPPVQCDPGALNPDNIKELNNTLEAIADERISEGELDFPIAGKTGTNNESTSTWFVGYTSELATASWMGRYTNINETLEGSTIGGRYYDDVWGSIIAGPMWVDYMKTAGPKYDTDEFPEFDGPTGDPSKEGNSSSDDSDSDSDSDSDDSDSDDGDSDESSDEDDSAGDND